MLHEQVLIGTTYSIKGAVQFARPQPKHKRHLHSYQREPYPSCAILKESVMLAPWMPCWTSFPLTEFTRIKAAAEKIKSDSDALIVIGIGGSYLRARAAIDALAHSFYNLLPKTGRGTPEVYFVGNNISATYIIELLELLKDKDISVNVISKSGTTTEPALAFRIFREYMEKRLN